LLRACERLLQERGLSPVCRTAGCAAPISCKEAPSAAASSSVDGAAPLVCATCGTGAGDGPEAQAEGQPVANDRKERGAFFRCTDGHSNQCEACWEQDIQKTCAAWMCGEVSGAAAAGTPADALMRALPPPVLVPERKPSAAVPAAAAAAAAAAASAAEGTETPPGARHSHKKRHRPIQPNQLKHPLSRGF